MFGAGCEADDSAVADQRRSRDREDGLSDTRRLEEAGLLMKGGNFLVKILEVGSPNPICFRA